MNGVHMVGDISEDEYKQIDEILLDENGGIKLVPAKSLEGIPQINLSLWSKRNAIYSIVTTELIDFLKTQIGDKSAIEIGAGKNIIGKELGIPQTDSYLQTRPEIIDHYERLGHPVIKYPQSVLKLEATEAVTKFNPSVVIGSWIMQLGGPSIPQSSPFGVNESGLIKRVDKYIMIGHEGTHWKKKILGHPHNVYKFPWLYSRSLEPEYNRIWVWSHDEN